jgi:hypothetical protein
VVQPYIKSLEGPGPCAGKINEVLGLKPMQERKRRIPF